MEKYYLPNRTTWYRQRDNTIVVNAKVNSYNVIDFCAAVSIFNNSGNNNLTLDFSCIIVPGKVWEQLYGKL